MVTRIYGKASSADAVYATRSTALSTVAETNSVATLRIVLAASFAHLFQPAGRPLPGDATGLHVLFTGG